MKEMKRNKEKGNMKGRSGEKNVMEREMRNKEENRNKKKRLGKK